MRLALQTDYALRLLLVLGADPAARWPLPVLAEAHDISLEHLRKVSQRLVQGGFVESRRGRGGGVSLAQDAADIDIGAVVRWMEPDLAVVECLGDHSQCRIVGACRLQGLLQRARAAFLAELDGVALAACVARPAAMFRALGLSPPSPS